MHCNLKMKKSVLLVNERNKRGKGVGSSRKHEGRFSKDLPVFFCWRLSWVVSPWTRPSTLWLLVCLAFSLPTEASPTLQGAWRDGFGEAAVLYVSHASFRDLRVGRGKSYRPTRKLRLCVFWSSSFFFSFFFFNNNNNNNEILIKREPLVYTRARSADSQHSV